MSEKWEESIQQWYINSHTSKLDYLDLAESKNPTRKELAQNLAVIYDRTYLSSRVHLKNFKILIEKNQSLEKEIKALKSSVETLSALLSENNPISRQEIKGLIIELSKEFQERGLNQKLSKIETLLTKIERQICG